MPVSIPTSAFARAPKASRLQPTIEHIDDEESVCEHSSSPASSVCSSAFSSRNSVVDDEDIEEILNIDNPAPIARRDIAHEVALSLWGVIKPRNFAGVMPGVYRCAFPRSENFLFMKTLGLKSVLTLVPDQYPAKNEQFILQNGIQHFQVGIEPNKNPFVTISQCNISAALSIVLDRSNHPILIHCNKGKHRTGCLVGCLRKIMGWDMEAIIAEYRHYAGTKARSLDERFIELFDERAMLWLARSQAFVPIPEPYIDESPITALSVGSRLRS